MITGCCWGNDAKQSTGLSTTTVAVTLKPGHRYHRNKVTPSAETAEPCSNDASVTVCDLFASDDPAISIAGADPARRAARAVLRERQVRRLSGSRADHQLQENGQPQPGV